MHVTNKIKIDLTKPDPTLVISAVQGEAYTRSLQITLYSGFHPWTIPTDISATVRYAKPDRTKGYYDTLPGGTSAWHAEGNTLTIFLAPQMLTVPGSVETQIQLIQGSHILSTFSLTVFVEADPAIGAIRSEDYINWLQWIEEQAEDQISLAQQAAETACQASQAAALAAENIAVFADNAVVAATNAENYANNALKAAASTDDAKKETEAIAGTISAIVAGNEAYTKKESHTLFSTAILPKVIGETLALKDSLCQPLHGLRILGKTTQKGIPSPESPVALSSVGDSGNLSVTIHGKNLLQYPYLSTSKTQNGVTFTDNGDGSITIQGTATTTTWFNLTSHNLKGWYSSQYLLAPFVFSGLSQGITMEHDPVKKLTFLSVSAKIPIDTTIYPQIEVGSVATDWEPPVTAQIISVPTPNGLPGIPVASNGSYTDETGQQWICDEIDFSRGVFVQRLTRIHSYNGEIVGDCFLSSTGKLSTGADVLYPLDIPQESTLVSELLTEYQSLHTRYRDTTLLCSEKTLMQLTYIADTKLYIDNKMRAFVL